MVKISITGHQNLKDSSLWVWVKGEIHKILDKYEDRLVGFSSLAVGADQLFADAVLEHEGDLQAIIPFDSYELKFSKGKERENYFRLLHKAISVDVLEKEESEESSYFTAGKKVVDMSELLIAVWDGKPAAGLGGTGDVVKYALQNNKKIVHINPETKTVIEK